MANKIMSFRLNQEQLQRIRSIASYWGMATDTEIVQWALNLLEKRITSPQTDELVSSCSSVKKQNTALERMKRTILELKRNTNLAKKDVSCNTKAEDSPLFLN
jgi:hypothetical protein